MESRDWSDGYDAEELPRCQLHPDRTILCELCIKADVTRWEHWGRENDQMYHFAGDLDPRIWRTFYYLVN